eukprot:PhM_4_TR10094/c3_g6_i1/m.19670
MCCLSFDMIFHCFAADELRVRALVLAVMFSRCDGHNWVPLDVLEQTDGILDFAIKRPPADYVDFTATGMGHMVDCVRKTWPYDIRKHMLTFIERSAPYNIFQRVFLALGHEDQTVSLCCDAEERWIHDPTFQVVAGIFKIVLPLGIRMVNGRAVWRAVLDDSTNCHEMAHLHLYLCRALSLVPPQFWYDANDGTSSDDDDDDDASVADDDDNEEEEEEEEDDDDSSDETYDDESKGCRWMTWADPVGLQHYLPKEPTVGSFIHIPICFAVDPVGRHKTKYGDVVLYFTRVRGVVMQFNVCEHDTIMVQGPASFRLVDIVDDSSSKSSKRILYLEQVSTDFSVHKRLVSHQSEFNPHNFDLELVHSSSNISFVSCIDLCKVVNLLALQKSVNPNMYYCTSDVFGRNDIAHLLDGRDFSKRDLLIQALTQRPRHPHFFKGITYVLSSDETAELPDSIPGTIRTMTVQDFLTNWWMCEFFDLAHCLRGDDTVRFRDGTQWTSTQLCIKAAEILIDDLEDDFPLALECIALAARIHRFRPVPMKDLEGRLGFP